MWEFLESLDMKANWNDNRQGVARGEVASDLGDKRLWLFRFWHGTYDDDQLRKHYNLTMSDMKNFMNCISERYKLRLLDDVPKRPFSS